MRKRNALARAAISAGIVGAASLALAGCADKAEQPAGSASSPVDTDETLRTQLPDGTVSAPELTPYPGAREPEATPGQAQPTEPKQQAPTDRAEATEATPQTGEQPEATSTSADGLVSEDGKTYLYRQGRRQTGWQEVDGVRWRFDDVTGEAQIACDERVVMCQAYGPWAETPCGPTSNIRVSGCGAAALAHALTLILTPPDATTPHEDALSRWADDDITPEDVVDAMEHLWPNGAYYLVGDGVRPECLREAVEQVWGLATGTIDRNRGMTSVEDIRAALEAGRCVIASSIGEGADVFSSGNVGTYYASGGHYICFYQVKDGLFWAKDSGGPERGASCLYDEAMMRRFLDASPAGACFWVGRA